MPTPRTSVFISYSHADEKWRKLVEKHLTPLKRDYHLRIWSDQNLLEGEPWLDRIKRELATAKVGILLISANFMASDFIQSDELPPLLAAARQEGVTLLSVMVGYCHFATSPLSKLQAFNKPDRPLSALTPPQRDKEMARLCARLLKLFGLPAAGKKSAASVARRAPAKPEPPAEAPTSPVAAASKPLRPPRARAAFNPRPTPAKAPADSVAAPAPVKAKKASTPAPPAKSSPASAVVEAKAPPPNKRRVAGAKAKQR